MNGLLDKLKQLLGGAAQSAGNAIQQDVIKPAASGLGQVRTGISNFLTQANNAGAIGVTNPIQPTFVQTALAKIPQINFTDQIKNPVLKFAASIPQSIINAPHDLGVASVKTQKDLKAGFKSPQQVIGDIAGEALPVATVATLPMGGDAALLENGGKEGLLQILKNGATTGAKYGLGFGALQGAKDTADAPTFKDQAIQELRDSLLGGATGLVGGAAIAGVAHGATTAANKIASTFIEDEIKNLNPSKAAELNIVNIKPAYEAINKDETMIQSVVQNFKDNPSNGGAASDIENLTSKYLPEFKGKTTMQQADIWDTILGLKNNPEYVSQNKELINPALSDTVNYIFGQAKQQRQAGFIKPSEFFPGKKSIKDELTEPPLPPKMSSQAIREGITTPRSGADISVNPDATQRFGDTPIQGEGFTARPQTFEEEMDQMSKEFPGEENFSTKEQLGPQMAERSESAQKNAETQVLSEINGGNWLQHNISMLKGLPDDFKSKFQEWVGGRQAAPYEGLYQRQPFQEIDAAGNDIISQLKNADPKLLDNVRAYFDSKYGNLTESGLDLNYKETYFPQLWKETQKVVDEKMGKQLSMNPSFTFDSVIKNYEEGVAKGLTPRFNNVSDLVGWYEMTANKAMADRNFFNWAIQSGYVTKNQGDGMVAIQNFPKTLSHTGDNSTYAGNYYAPKPIADVLNNFMTHDDGALANVANAFSKMKRMALSTGIPGTAIGPHGFNEFARSAQSGQNPLTTAWMMIHPSSGGKFVNENLDQAIPLIKAGLTLKTTEAGDFRPAEEEQAGNLMTSGLKGITDIQRKFFEDPVFSNFAPALKLKFAIAQRDALLKAGLPEDQALKTAASQANTRFGGINYDYQATNKQFFNMLRTTVLAPDWLATNLGIGKGIVKALLNPSNPAGKTYLNYLKNFAGAYVAANVVNYALSGHTMLQNGPTNMFNIDTGTYTSDGQKRYVRIFGTADDFLRIPVEIAAGLLSGQSDVIAKDIRNRVSTPAGAALTLLSGQDYAGNGIYKGPFGQKYSPAQVMGNVVNTLLGGVGLPPQIAAAGKFLTGQTSPEEFAVQETGAPVRYMGGAYSPAQQKLADLYKGLGYNGEQIAQQLAIQKQTNSKTSSGGTTVAPAAPASAPTIVSPALQAPKLKNTAASRIRSSIKSSAKKAAPKLKIKKSNLSSGFKPVKITQVKAPVVAAKASSLHLPKPPKLALHLTLPKPKKMLRIKV